MSPCLFHKSPLTCLRYTKQVSFNNVIWSYEYTGFVVIEELNMIAHSSNAPDPSLSLPELGSYSSSFVFLVLFCS